MIPPACHRSLKAIPDQTNSLSDPRRSYYPVLSVSVPVIFSLSPPPPVSFRHQLKQTHDFFCLDLAPYVPTRRLHVQLVYMPVCVRPAAADVADQDCLTTLRDIKLVGILSC